MNTKYLKIGIIAFLISACNQKNKNPEKKAQDSPNLQIQKEIVDSLGNQQTKSAASLQKDDAEEWLTNIFKTKSSDKYFPEYNVEEKLCTKRFQKFIAESGDLYGPSNLTDEEYPTAEKKYKDKWSTIYPIEEREMWLFGRGNGDIGELKQLEVSKLNDKVYRVYIDYGNDIKTENEVTVVSENGNFKIDYCKTIF